MNIEGEHFVRCWEEYDFQFEDVDDAEQAFEALRAEGFMVARMNSTVTIPAIHEKTTDVVRARMIIEAI